MPSSHRTILALQLTSAEFARVERAARLSWPDAVLTPVPSLDAATRVVGAAGCEMLVMGAETPEDEHARAAQITTADGLPRWPVVVLQAGNPSERIWHALPPAGGADTLAALLAVAAAQHAAQRAAIRATGDFRTIARRISHEMRSPLGSILTSVDVLREELADQPGMVEGLLQPVVDSAADIMELLDRLSLLTRATGRPLESGPVDMATIVWAAVERCARRIAAADAEISEPDGWPEVWGVADWLESVWGILLGSALDHANGAKLKVELGWERRDGVLRFHVRDHGASIAPEFRRLLFRPFHQLHETDSGRGMGLALVQRLVELQGGCCGYEPIEPHGSCLFFTLPAPPEATS